MLRSRPSVALGGSEIGHDRLAEPFEREQGHHEKGDDHRDGDGCQLAERDEEREQGVRERQDRGEHRRQRHPRLGKRADRVRTRDSGKLDVSHADLSTDPRAT